MQGLRYDDRCPTRSILFPNSDKPTYIIDPVAFFAALIGAPILFTLATFWVFLIPVFALLPGGQFYLVIGTPMQFWYLRHHKANPRKIAELAPLANLALMAAMAGFAILTNRPHQVTAALYYSGCGLLFAPIWGRMFGWLYQKMRREIYTPPTSDLKTLDLKWKGNLLCYC
ncbi:MAG: hypothetical protein ACI92Z_002699 [Paracoccaceae bacterium]|jgi:hypothetical protein